MSLPDGSPPDALTSAALEKILALLAPLFRDSTVVTRDAVMAILAHHGARTDQQVRLAAISIAFSFGALDSLARSSASNLPLSQVLRLRENAGTLSAVAQQSQDALDRLLANMPTAGVEPSRLDENLGSTGVDRPGAEVRQGRGGGHAHQDIALVCLQEDARRRARTEARSAATRSNYGSCRRTVSGAFATAMLTGR